ncbi:MAG TPA: tetratricopeptide repeat protein [Candidatus Paceibacterota bacterium]|nr:tetratricopeptide repeat protein [Verrucomicrobiota bacterium]HRZ45887.1 tetratricopeptide repeat protein [Candidatus Paceibacterota bacterium]
MSRASPHPRSRAPSKGGRRRAAPAVAVGLAVLLLVGIGILWKKDAGRQPAGSHPAPSAEAVKAYHARDAAVFTNYSGSASCRECHLEAYEAWRGSHHALAERDLDAALDRAAFDPPRTFTHGSQTSTVRARGERYELLTPGWGGQTGPYPARRVLGVDPLRQFLVEAPGGRFQMTEIAFDPNRKDWFNVYAEEDRQPGEWGHWTGRGMNWNNMCAICHNTRLRKNYEPATDSYLTARAEMGVGCEACHGPGRAHTEWQQAHTNATPAEKRAESQPLRFSKEQVLSVCGACHSRRTDFTWNFAPGDNYYDHYFPVIPSETDTYYPDGQVRDEDFEYVSFLGSRMYSLGVRCQDCHDVHRGKTVAQGNDLCLRCHQATIDPWAHGHHHLDKSGSTCQDCHMPITVYMARHPRHDHGFTIPDPMLTRDFAVPNACNRCHTDKTVAWSIENVDLWYGQRMDRHTQARARWIARARQSDPNVKGDLLRMAREERIPMWRAIALALLRLWAAETDVYPVLLEAARDPAPLVRGNAARALEPALGLGDSRIASTLQRLLRDATRMVRVEAAWALRATLDPQSAAARDLVEHLESNADQPNGQMQYGAFLAARGQSEPALERFRRAAAWDATSAAVRHSLAVVLSEMGRHADAVQELETACQLEPRNAYLQFSLGLALAETAQISRAIAAFEKSIESDPNLARAHYNLGLARSQAGEPQAALDAIARAESIDPRQADYPYARATILARIGRVAEARSAALRALEISPERPDIQEIARMLGAGR